MPWCASCSRYLSPSTVRADATCPECGRRVEPLGTPEAPSASTGAGTGAEAELRSVPWHAKLLAAAVALYLGFRGWQGVEWLLDKL